MRIIKKWQLLTMLVANTVALNACGNSNAENKQANSNNRESFHHYFFKVNAKQGKVGIKCIT